MLRIAKQSFRPGMPADIGIGRRVAQRQTRGRTRALERRRKKASKRRGQEARLRRRSPGSARTASNSGSTSRA
jgi:hypothetical protein